MKDQGPQAFTEEEQMRLRASMLRIIPLSDRIAERFLDLTCEELSEPGFEMTERQRDRLMVLLATLVDQVRSRRSFDSTCRKLAAEELGLPAAFLFGPSGETALRRAIAEVAWSLVEPDEIELWAKLQRKASRSYFGISKNAIAEFGSPLNETDGSGTPSPRVTSSR
ncbi:MAG: hypothetical protein HZC36_00040 [Armatimonadetes bacterium]|nr:hypothetical protein [Armatimonadota bacterium]